MKLEDMGYNSRIGETTSDGKPDNSEYGRVIAEHREHYVVRTVEGEFESEVTGNLRYNAAGREDFPAVGDWVTVNTFDSGFAVIHQVLPRYSVLKRQAVGQYGEMQVIAANIDFALITQSADRDFNMNRLERYLTICHASRVSPVILLTKTDLIRGEETAAVLKKIKQRIPDVPVIAVSNKTQFGYDELKLKLEKGKTYCMLGSSGVGKSTLLNNLSGKTVMETGEISRKTGKGKHVTTHRELTILENGAILIDNPGMREVGIADPAGGLETTFDRITGLAADCRYTDCTHTGETNCAVLAAVTKGEIDQELYSNYLKLEKEKSRFESTAAERRRKDRSFGKLLKNYKKSFRKR